MPALAKRVDGVDRPLTDADMAQRAQDASAAALARAPDLPAHAADARWRAETGGIVVGGVPIATDDRSKILILGSRVAAASDPAWTTVWIAQDGSQHTLDAPTMIAVSDAVGAHVASCFATYCAVMADIASGEVTTAAEIDARFVAPAG